MALFSSLSEIDLGVLSKEITDNAVDIFVYDTSKDSDGGKWRKRTKDTSWYNEPLNTATRGSRREFPAVAVITVQTAATNTDSMITIYDGDDPDLPMWMVFRTNISGGGNDQTTSTLYYAAGPYQTRKVAMLNGVMVDCQFRSTGHIAGLVKGVTRFNFIDDSSTMMTDEGDFKRNGNLGDERNTAKIYSKISTTTIVHTQCNDVAMTVLPNAPIDSATGLPVPTIAVATDGGVSVIKDDGTVISGGEANNSWSVKKLFFDENNTLWACEGTDYSPGIQLMSTEPYSTVNSIGTGTLGYQLTTQITTVYGQNTSWPYVLGSFGSYANNHAAGKNFISTGSLGGLTFISDNTTNRSNSMVAYATTSYNTGWMHGDIKGAFLSDTDATNVTGTELVTNGTFDSDLSSWGTAAYNGTYPGTVTWDSGTQSAKISNPYGTGLLCGINQTINGLTSGKQYVVTFDILSGTSGGTTHEVAEQNIGYSGPGTYSVYFTPNSSSYNLRFGVMRVSYAVTAYYDNISVKLAEEDRSVNAKGLQVFGTVTKSAVATGADLVAYSGFSNSTNYLRQPYNSVLDFGTGDFSIMTWFYMPDVSATGFIVDRADVSTGGNRLALYTETSLLRFYTFDGAVSQQDTSISNRNNTWIHAVATRSSSGAMTLYLNGEQVSSAIQTVRNTTNTSASTSIGIRYTGATNSFSGSISLLRISGSIPSPEQIKKIYEDEKYLFQENAKCTLYGSSDAVTALAYDDSNDTLHVGTSSGRSDFEGLRRINNTTTGITTAISASNGLIAEQ